MKLKYSFLIVVMLTSFISHAQDLTPTMVFPVDYLPIGTHKFDLMVKNVGSGIIPYNGFKIGWAVDNGMINEQSPAIPTYGIVAGGMERTAGNFTATFSTVGLHTLKVWTRTTSVTDANTANDTIIKIVKVLPYVPAKNVILEVFKHQACCPCIDAAEYEDTAVNPYGKYAVANIYTGPSDPLYNAEGDTLNDLYQLAHPNVFFDRFLFPYKIDLENNFFVQNNIYQLRNMKERDRYYEPLEVFVAQAMFDSSSRLLKVKLKAKVYDTISKNYRFNLYVTEDSIKGYQGCYTPPNDYYHSHVVRKMAGGTWGSINSLPAIMYPAVDYFYEFTYTIPVNYKLQHLTLIPLVQQFDNDKMNSRIINSSKINFNNAIALTPNFVASVDPQKIQFYPNPATDKLIIEMKGSLEKPIYAEVIDAAGKVVKQFTVKEQKQEVNISDLPPSTYTLKMNSVSYQNISYQFIKN